MQNARPLTEAELADTVELPNVTVVPATAPERLAAQWVSRATAVVGGLTLIVALINWAARPGHYRITLALLVIAMFCAILHSYTLENGEDR